MLHIAHSPSSSDLPQSNPYYSIWLWGRHNSQPQSRKSGAGPKQSSGMEPTSPKSPNSPTSTDATSSPTQPLTPTSPSVSTYKSIWGSSKKLNEYQSAPRSTWSNTPSSNERKLTLQYILESPRSPSFTTRMLKRNTDASSSVNVDEASRGCSTSLINPDESVMSLVDQDGDMMMRSPVDTEYQNAWAATTTSPILRKLVGVPEHSAFEGETHQRTQGLQSAASNQPERPAQNNLQPMTVPTSTNTKSQSRSRSQSKTSSRLRMERSGRSKDRNGSDVSQFQSHSRSRSSMATRKPFSSYPSRILIPDENKRQLQRSIEHLGIRLIPLISVTSGQPHPDFPRSVLQYHLLTHHQLDSLACWYHQTVDNGRERFMYPAIIEQPWTWENERMRSRMAVAHELSGEPELDLATKRRRFGRFIGLRGCESPIIESVEGEIEGDDIEKKQESLAEQMEREWKAALQRAEEEQQLQEKMWRGRW